MPSVFGVLLEPVLGAGQARCSHEQMEAQPCRELQA